VSSGVKESLTSSLQPLSERVLAQLRGRRELWIAIWAFVPWANVGVNLLLGGERTSAVWEQSATLVVLNYVALSLAVALSLIGAERIARRLEELHVETSAVLVEEEIDPFRGANSVIGPVVASAVTAMTFGTTALVEEGALPAVVRATTWFVLGLALFSFVWTYGRPPISRVHNVCG